MDTPVAISQSEPLQFIGKTFGARAVCYIIDVVILNVTTFVVSLVVGLMIGVALAILQITPHVREATLIENVIYGIPLSIAYYFLFEWLYGATPGKLILGMRVVKEDGSPCDARAAIVRALFRYIDGIFFALPAYSSMKAPLNQRLGDKSAKTIVVDQKQLVSGSQAWWRFAVAAALQLAFTSGVTLALLIGLIA